MKQSTKNPNEIICKKLPFKGFNKNYINSVCYLEYQGVRCTEQSHGLEVMGKNKDYVIIAWDKTIDNYRIWVKPPSKWNESANQAMPINTSKDWHRSILHGPASRIDVKFTCGEHKGKQTSIDLKIELPNEGDPTDRSDNFKGKKINVVGAYSGNKEKDIEIYDHHPTSDYIYGWPRKISGGSWLWTWNLNNNKINFIAYLKHAKNSKQISLINKMNKYVQSKLLEAIEDFNESIIDSPDVVFKDPTGSIDRYGDLLSYHCHNRFQITIENYINNYHKL